METEPFHYEIDPKTRFIVLFQYSSILKTAKNIAKHAQIPLNTCYFWLEKIKQGQDIFQVQEGRGRPPSVNRRKVVQQFRKNPSTSSTRKIARRTSTSHTSVRRVFQEEGIKFKGGRTKLPLTQKHKEDRLDWAESYVDNPEIFDNVFFVDETGFTLGEMHKTKQWVEEGQRPVRKDVNLNEVQKRVSCWAGISKRGATKIEIYQESFDSDLYLEILGRRVKEMSNLYPQGFSIVQDQLRAHTEGRVLRWLSSNTDEEVEILPAKSPDLNPIENVWGWLKECVKLDEPNNIEALKNCIKKHWKKVDVNFLRPYINSMPDRMQEVIDSEGDHTSY